MSHDRTSRPIRHPLGEAIYKRCKTSLQARTFSRIAAANMASANLSSRFAKKTAGEREATERADRSLPLPSER